MTGNNAVPDVQHRLRRGDGWIVWADGRGWVKNYAINNMQFVCLFVINGGVKQYILYFKNNNKSIYYKEHVFKLIIQTYTNKWHI